MHAVMSPKDAPHFCEFITRASHPYCLLCRQEAGLRTVPYSTVTAVNLTVGIRYVPGPSLTRTRKNLEPWRYGRCPVDGRIRCYSSKQCGNKFLNKTVLNNYTTCPREPSLQHFEPNAATASPTWESFENFHAHQNQIPQWNVRNGALLTSIEIFTLTETKCSSEKPETQNWGALLMSYQDR